MLVRFGSFKIRVLVLDTIIFLELNKNCFIYGIYLGKKKQIQSVVNSQNSFISNSIMLTDWLVFKSNHKRLNFQILLIRFCVEPISKPKTKNHGLVFT